MSDVGKFERFVLGANWVAYATLLDADGAPLPTLDPATLIEWRIGRPGRRNGVSYPALVIRSDEPVSAERGGILRVGPGKVKVIVSPARQIEAAMDNVSSYTHQFWVTLASGEPYCPVEGELVLRPRV